MGVDADLNQIYDLPDWVGVTVEACGEANGFYNSAYNPEGSTIAICTEYAVKMAARWESECVNFVITGKKFVITKVRI